MYRETEFEKTIKWFLFGAAGICALCQLILLFYEFTFFGGIGLLFNGLFHLIGIGCPVLLFILFFKQNENKEIYSNYAIAINIFSAIIVDLTLMIKYIMHVKDGKGFSIGIVIGLIILLVFEAISGLAFIKYGLDKITCVIPLIAIVVISIFRGSMLSAVDSSFNTYAYSTVKGSVFSIWTFMYLMFYVAMVVCLILYLDLGFLLDTINEPKELFTKKTIFGTYTNLYLKDEPANINQNNNQQNQLQNNVSNISQVSGQLNTLSDHEYLQKNIGVCQDCGNLIYEGQTICSKCGCPVSFTEQKESSGDIKQSNIHENAISESNNNETIIPAAQTVENDGMVCPDCKSIIYPGQTICSKCGCPVSFTTPKESFEDIKQSNVLESAISESNNNETVMSAAQTTEKAEMLCPDCKSIIYPGQSICSKCGCPINHIATVQTPTVVNESNNSFSAKDAEESYIKKSKDENFKTRNIIGIIIALIILLVILIGWYRNDISRYRALYNSNSYSLDKAQEQFEDLQDKHDGLMEVYYEIKDSMDNNSYDSDKSTIWSHYVKYGTEVSILDSYNEEKFLSGISSECSNITTEMGDNLEKQKEYLANRIKYSILADMSFGSFLSSQKVTIFIGIYVLVLVVCLLIVYKTQKK